MSTPEDPSYFTIDARTGNRRAGALIVVVVGSLALLNKPELFAHWYVCAGVVMASLIAIFPKGGPDAHVPGSRRRLAVVDVQRE